MSKKLFSKAIIAYILAVCCVISFNSTAFAINEVAINSINKPDLDVTIKELSIISDQAILQGETQQMQVEEFDEFTLLNFVEWSSSNPDVISCTSNGLIQGLKKGRATITVKAKVGGAEDSIVVYCAERINPDITKSNRQLAWSSKTPNIFVAQHIFFKIDPIWQKQLTVKGRYGNYFYITYTISDGTEADGFMHKFFLPETVGSEGMLRQLSVYNLNVFTGTTSETKVTTNYKGDVIWTVIPEGIIDFDDKTGTVTALKPGIATITATAGTSVKTCTVYSIYKWPLQWTGMTNRNTYIYKGNDGYYSTNKYKETGKLFTVCGDMGDSWAYGYDEYNNWGFIPISHISTKNTISYYRNLGWGYPLENKEYNYINSPHAPRPDYDDEHRGFDINEKKNQADIEGQKIVAAFEGTVKRTGADLNTTNGCGYYICITSNTVDPVTGKEIIAIYQHMKSPALFSESDEVKKGDVIGYVGNTGRSDGSHLHFEVNNWNAGIGDTGRSDFTYTVNPIYFYLDMVENNELILNFDCSAVNSGYSFYFYKYDKNKNGGDIKW